MDRTIDILIKKKIGRLTDNENNHWLQLYMRGKSLYILINIIAKYNVVLF